MPPPSERIARKEYHYKDGYESSNHTTVRYQAEWTKQHQLEGDGLLPLLYDHMYKSDKTRDQRLKGVGIPDTVVFEHNFPRAWYNYDEKREEILKQPGKQLDATSILNEFKQVGAGDCEIVAQFYYKSYTAPKSTLTSMKDEKKKETDRKKQLQNNQGTSSSSAAASHGGESRYMQSTDTVATVSGSEVATSTPRKKKHMATDVEEACSAVEFFTEDTLKDFLNNRKVKPDGVLQKFVCPKGRTSSRQNFCMQAVWSPKVTRIYKRTNVFRLNDRLNAVERKAATFDGPPHFSTESLVASSTSKKIEEVCKKIVHHFSATEHKPIERLVLYLKEDNKGKLWVLWASSLRIGGDKLNPVHLRVPMQFALKVHTEKSRNPNTAVAGPDMNHRLLDSDIALYEMTGDWLFARSRCADAGSHAPEDHPLGATTPRTTPRRPATGNNSTKDGGSSSSAPSRQQQSDSTPQEDLDNVEEGDERRLVMAGNSPRGSYREPAPPARFLSPRAPFLAQGYKPAPPTAPENPHHPLHEKYMAMLQEDEQTAQSKSYGHTGRKFTQRQSLTTASSPKMMTQQTSIEKLKDSLLHTTNDLLYQAYSVTLQHGSSNTRGSAFGDLPKHPDEIVVVPDLIKAALSPDQVQELLQCIRLEEVPGSDGTLYEAKTGALGRGRRQDRPLALLLQDVKNFYKQQFQQEGGAEIYERWKAYQDSLDAVDVGQDR